MKASDIKKIFVGVSGGVDSSVAAALLRDQGHDVTGVYIRTWQPDWMVCTWREERRDAMRVCAHLGIPFLELDAQDVYEKEVANYMIESYRQGKTPNPDILCNKIIKFGVFLDFAKAYGADAIATGHYAQIKQSREVLGISTFPELYRGADERKDQSYFLWTLSQEQLSSLMFPLGGMHKSTVRLLAQSYSLPTAIKKDSQGICFVGDISMKEFLKHYIEEKKGDVLDEEGNIIGYHNGALFFTLGERHGFIIDNDKKGTDDSPLYVIRKDVKKNTITVTPDLADTKEENNTNLITLHDVNDMYDSFFPDFSCQCQIRYHGEIKNCTITAYSAEKKTAHISLEKPDYTVASGQSIVFYEGDRCLGGGVID